MKVLEEIINVQRAAWENTDAGLRVAATLAPRRDSIVYKAHFPDKPITPGVCMIGAVVELLSQSSGKALQLAKVNNIKYLSMMSPDDVEGATLAATLNGDTATATFTKDDTVYAKMKLTLTSNA
ncbi:MAG: hypothetical protein K6F72_07885 [Bacteroidales bacterium]|nr:hypothetical protein [Bacteroidales bacterium]